MSGWSIVLVRVGSFFPSGNLSDLPREAVGHLGEKGRLDCMRHLSVILGSLASIFPVKQKAVF